MKPPFPAPVTGQHNDTYAEINPSRPELSQAGKIIVITGAGSGIGREIAHAFTVAGVERSKFTFQAVPVNLSKKLKHLSLQRPNAKVTVNVADILDAVALEEAAKKIGCWDVLVANAGYIPKPDLMETSDPDEWWKTFEVYRSPDISL